MSPPARANPPRRSPVLPIIFALIAVLVLLGAAGGAVYVYARDQLAAPSGTAGQGVTIRVDPGEPVARVADDLFGHQLIKSRFWFEQYARLRGLSGKLKAGYYRFDDGMGASAIIARLEVAPDQPARTLTLTEGMTAQQMSVRVAATLGIKADSYMNEVTKGSFDEPFLAGRPPGASLEGYLFPDTYAVAANITAHELVQRQLDDFALKGAALLGKPPSGYTAYQVLSVAALVEREARNPGDRPKVASVIYNRLAAGMRLQIDAAVLYGLGQGAQGASPTQDQLNQDTPYNTYLHAGLTPSPIANPGASSIAAAAQPASTTLLFYVNDNCGALHFSSDDTTHQQLVARYVGAGKSCQ